MISCRPISPADRDEAVEVLTLAFAGYPFLERTFHNGRQPSECLRRTMFGIAIDGRIRGCHLCYVAEREGQIVGVATLSSHAKNEWPDDLDERWAELESQCSEDGRAHFEAYQNLQREVFDDTPHVYVVAIGVNRAFHGHGIGRKLLEAVNPQKLRLRLDTHEPANVEKYLRLGFRLVHEGDLRGMPNWFFER